MTEDLLLVDGMSLNNKEQVNARHLINAAQYGNSKAESVFRTGTTDNVQIDLILFSHFDLETYFRFCSVKNILLLFEIELCKCWLKKMASKMELL